MPNKRGAVTFVLGLDYVARPTSPCTHLKLILDNIKTVLQLHQKAGKNQHPGSRRDWSEQVGQARTAGPVLGGREGKDHFVGTESKETWLLCFAFLRQAALMPPSWTAKALKTVSAGRLDA